MSENRDVFLRSVGSLFDRFHNGRLTDQDYTDVSAVDARIHPEHVDWLVTSKAIVEPDVIPFRWLDDPATVILDVGAHLGYTAATLRNLPTRNFVHSLEPVTLYNPMLARLAELDPKYSFSNVACSDKSETCSAYNLIVNGGLIGGTTTIDGATFHKSLSEYLTTRIGESWLPVCDSYDARLLRFTFETRPLDCIVSSWEHLGRRISGLKIDVEGHEHQTIAGAGKVLTEHKPLLMIETSDHPRMTASLEPLGYVPYERVDNKIRPMVTPYYNAYFVHRDQVYAYKALGLIA